MIWNLLNWVVNFLFWIALAWIVLGIVGIGMVGNRRPARIIDEGRVEFAPHWFTFCAWLLFIIFMAKSILIHSKEYRNIPWMQNWNVPWNFVFLAYLGLVAVGILYDLPASIVVSEEGLEQVYWFRRRKRIRWKDIVEIESRQKDHTFTITSTDGTKIVHTGFLADRPRLLLEIKQHCSDELPPDFPGESLGG